MDKKEIKKKVERRASQAKAGIKIAANAVHTGVKKAAPHVKNAVDSAARKIKEYTPKAKKKSSSAIARLKQVPPKIWAGIAAVAAIIILIVILTGGEKDTGKEDLSLMLDSLDIAHEITVDGKEVLVSLTVPSDASPEYMAQMWYYIFGATAGVFEDSYEITIKNYFDTYSWISISADIKDVNAMTEEKMSYAEFSKKLDIQTSK